MKRFLLFGGMSYYPGGGWTDFIGSFDTLEAVRDAGRDHRDRWEDRPDWLHIVDTESMRIVLRSFPENILASREDSEAVVWEAR